MKVIVDTNIVFSAILNNNSRIGKILLRPEKRISFYAPEFLLSEINEHSKKIQKISGYTDDEFEKMFQLVTRNIRFIDSRLISKSILLKSFELMKDIDVDDTEFIALTMHLKGKLWSGDKKLISKFKSKNQNTFISIDELTEIINN